MPPVTVSVLKFVGTVGLGLLTGISYTHTSLTTPLLLTLPSATTASRTHNTLTHLSSTHSNALLLLSLSSYTLSYALSPRKGGRHPYLLWTSLLSSLSWAVGWGMDVWYARRDRLESAASGSGVGTGVNGRMEEDDYIDATHSSANIMTPTSGQSESGDAAGGFGLNDDNASAGSSPLGDARVGGTKGGAAPTVNGEQIRVAIERFGFVEGVKACMTGCAFLMAVVGIWGDGVGVRQ